MRFRNSELLHKIDFSNSVTIIRLRAFQARQEGFREISILLVNFEKFEPTSNHDSYKSICLYYTPSHSNRNIWQNFGHLCIVSVSNSYVVRCCSQHRWIRFWKTLIWFFKCMLGFLIVHSNKRISTSKDKCSSFWHIKLDVLVVFWILDKIRELVSSSRTL